MIVKSTFTLFFISAVMTASSVSAGSVRGASQEEGTRHLETVTTWRGNCDTQPIVQCAGQDKMSMCTQCLFAQSLLSSPSIASCDKSMCGGNCEKEAQDFYNCGTGNLPTSPPVSGPATSADPLLVTPLQNAPNVTTSTTSLGCPLVFPGNGGDCTGLIPEPFLFHKCYYREFICECRKDAPNYLCSERVFTPAPIPPPTNAPTPVPTTPPTAFRVSECSDDIASGTACAAVGLSCCVDGKSQCTCGSDNFFLCQSDDCNSASPTVSPAPTLFPTEPPTPFRISECSDDIVSGTACAVAGLSCCVDGKSQCTCGSDNFFICQRDDCTSASPTVSPAPTLFPTEPPTPFRVSECSDDIASGTACAVAGLSCCVNGRSQCTCGSDNFFLCQREDCTSASPTISPAPTHSPTTPPTAFRVTECSDDIASGTACAVAGLSCCVNGRSQCTCGSDNFFLCQRDNCGPEETLSPIPETLPEIDSNVTLPETTSNATDVTLPEVDSNVTNITTLPGVEETPAEDEPVTDNVPEEDKVVNIVRPEDIPLFDWEFPPLLPSN